jgi:hypothetical protein
MSKLQTPTDGIPGKEARIAFGVRLLRRTRFGLIRVWLWKLNVQLHRVGLMLFPKLRQNRVELHSAALSFWEGDDRESVLAGSGHSGKSKCKDVVRAVLGDGHKFSPFHYLGESEHTEHPKLHKDPLGNGVVVGFKKFIGKILHALHLSRKSTPAKK